MNLYELGRWKRQIMMTFVKDKNITDILIPIPNEDYELEDQLLGDGTTEMPGCIFPHEYIPGTQEEAKSFICVEAVVPKITSASTETVYIYVWDFCHKSLLDTYRRSGVQGTRTDILSSDIDKCLNGNKDLQNAIGKMNLVSVNVYKPANNYYGRALVYECSTFNRGQR